ncbi:MAG: hypothetical protein Q4C12_04930 [Clostridia bacterium]|nr:hypothetical protein [Clostridia bacterium]
MSKKVFGYLLLDLFFIGLVTALFLWLKHCCGLIEYDIARKIAIVVLAVMYVIIDCIIAFFFFLYWWSDKKWTNIKRKFRK